MGAGKGRMRALLRLIGPWPLRPSVATAFVAVFLMVWVGSAISSEGMPVSPENQQRLLLAIPSAVIIGLVLYLAKGLLGPRAERLGPYLAILALAALAGSVFRAATEQLPEEAFSAIEAVIAFSAVRLFLFLVVIHAILGRITERFENQVQGATVKTTLRQPNGSTVSGKARVGAAGTLQRHWHAQVRGDCGGALDGSVGISRGEAARSRSPQGGVASGVRLRLPPMATPGPH